MKQLHMVTFLLLVVGGINWLSVGLLGTDLVATLLGGASSVLAKAVYILVGLSAVYEVATHKAACRTCSADGAPAAA